MIKAEKKSGHLRTLIIDNFDSFTYNLYQYCAELGGNPVVVRNNEITINQIIAAKYTHIILSPGPGSPDKEKDFGICADVIKKLAGQIPILGVCLGHQGIIHYLGGKVVRAPHPVHGKQSTVTIDNSSVLFKDLPETTEVMRYHSLIGEKKSLPADLKIISETVEDKLIMAVAHKSLPLYGVQFHPESIDTAVGKTILKNFLSINKASPGAGISGDICERRLPMDHVSGGIRSAVPEAKGRRRSGRPHSDAELTKQMPSELPECSPEIPAPGEAVSHILENMLSGKYSQHEMSQFLKTLAENGETVEQITAAVKILRKHMVNLPDNFKDLMDTCGTGGSGLPRMNISTTAAFVLAACGVKIAKHGNRASSGRCGSFDLLENLGVNINLTPGQIMTALKKHNIAFLFAPNFHPAMKIFGPVRKALGIRTIFNLIGPLVNPAKPAYHLLGTNSKETAEKLIQVMKNLNYKHAMVVVGQDGLDDITLNGKTFCYELKNKKIHKFEFSPAQLGIKSVKNFQEISGGSPEQNAKIFMQLLQNKAPKSLQNLLLLNCAFALYIRGKTATLKKGLKLADQAIQSGAAIKKFQNYKEFSTQPI